MNPMSAFLWSMQAAGLVSSIFGAKSQGKYIKLGRQLEQEQFQTNLDAIKLESAESSLDEMKSLRQNISSQIVNNAAKGNRGGSSYNGINEASNNFENDERKRRMNLMAKESNLRANNVLSGLHTLQSETQLGQSLTSSFLNTIPTTSLFQGKKKNAVQSAGRSAGKSVQDEAFSWGY